MSMLSINPSKLLFSSLVVVVFLASIESSQAKRGCSAFGHSCFGGHGKRSDPTSNPSEPEEIPIGVQTPSNDLGAYFVNGGPRQVELFSRDQEHLDSNDINALFPPQYQSIDPDDFARLSPVFRKWILANYRRAALLGVRK